MKELEERIQRIKEIPNIDTEKYGEHGVMLVNQMLIMESNLRIEKMLEKIKYLVTLG